MTTSNSINFNMNRDDIIRAALRKIGVVGRGRPPSAQDIADGAEELNRIVCDLITDGAHLWKYENLVVFLQKNKQVYKIGSAGDHATFSYLSNTFTVSAITAATNIVISSTTGLAVNDNIGLLLDSGVLQWATITQVNVGSVDINTGLLSAASAGNVIYTYTTKATRPLRISNMRLKISENSEIPISKISQSDYANIVNKTSSSNITQGYYQPNLDNGLLYVWPTASDASLTIQATAEISLQDFDIITDNPDFPREWLQALVWLLAENLTYDYGVDLNVQDRVSVKAAQYLARALAYDQQDAPLTLQFDYSNDYGNSVGNYYGS